VTTTTVAAGDGVTLAADLHGEGEPLVILHGFVGSKDDWAPLVPELCARDLRVVVPDHRGHGASTNTGDATTYSFDRLVDDARQVVEQLDLAPCHLLGHSMGGVVALQLSLEHPELVRSLVLVDCSPVPVGRPSPVGRALRSVVGRRIGLGRLVRWLGPVLRHSPYPAALVAGRRRHGASMIDDLAARLDAVDPEAFVVLGAELSTHHDLRPRLAEIAIPTTVIVGEHDTAGLRRGADLLAGGIAGAALHVVPGAGHSPQDENTAAVLAALDDHRRRLGP
jgi:3-oxoadipate enol-lactonase